jgi:hypothetical protein
MLADSLDVALRLAREACREVMRIYATDDFGETRKKDGSPVTAADLAANGADDYPHHLPSRAARTSASTSGSRRSPHRLPV